LLAHEFPIGSVATVGENDFYVIGWTNEDLILSPHWIWPPNHEAVEQHSRCRVSHVRTGEVTIRRYRRGSARAAHDKGVHQV
jgi:hypothetical protein